MPKKINIPDTPYKPDYTPSPPSMSVLPFIKGTGMKRNNWAIQSTDDYGFACRKGQEYAAHLVQYMQDNPSWVGSNLISSIVKDMDFNDETTTKGYYVGFFSYLEKILWNFTNVHDAWGYFEQQDEASRKFAIKFQESIEA